MQVLNSRSSENETPPVECSSRNSIMDSFQYQHPPPPPPPVIGKLVFRSGGLVSISSGIVGD